MLSMGSLRQCFLYLLFTVINPSLSLRLLHIYFLRILADSSRFVLLFLLPFLICSSYQVSLTAADCQNLKSFLKHPSSLPFSVLRRDVPCACCNCTCHFWTRRWSQHAWMTNSDCFSLCSRTGASIPSINIRLVYQRLPQGRSRRFHQHIEAFPYQA